MTVRGLRLVALAGVMVMAGCSKPAIPGIDGGPVVLSCSGTNVTTTGSEVERKDETRLYEVTGGEEPLMRKWDARNSRWKDLAFHEEMTIGDDAVYANIDATSDTSTGFRSVQQSISLNTKEVTDGTRRDLPDVKDEAVFTGTCQIVTDPAS